MKKSIVFWIVLLFITGCSSRTQYVDEGYKNQEELITMGIDRGEFEKAAVEATESLLQSGVLNKQGGERYVVGIDQIINDTTQRIDTDMLIKKIRVALLRSGKAIVTTAIQVGGPESTLSHSVRELRSNEEVKGTTIAKKNAMIAPDMGLSGKILQRNARTGSGKQLVEYYFQLTLTHIESGLAFWEHEVIIGKVGSKKTVSW